MFIFTPHDRITNAESGSISSSLFEFLYFDSGSAIQIARSGFSLSIDSSFFRFCVSTKQGGAIYFRGAKTSISRTCFDTCFRFGTVNDIWGNAIFSQFYGTAAESSDLNLTSFFGCGPSENSGDSTVYYESHPLESENLNFSQCCGYGGPTSICTNYKSVRSKFLSTYGGKSWQILDIVSSASMTIEKMISLNFSQMHIPDLFCGLHYDVTDCCLFLSKRIGELGDVTFKGNCYSNIDLNYPGLTETMTTEMGVPKIKADGYCQNQNSMNPGNILNLKFLCISRLQLLPYHQEDKRDEDSIARASGAEHHVE